MRAGFSARNYQTPDRNGFDQESNLLNERIQIIKEVQQMILSENPLIEKTFRKKSRVKNSSTFSVRQNQNNKSEVFEIFKKHMRESGKNGLQPVGDI